MPIRFMLSMIFASSLGFFRLVLLAILLVPTQFGTYSAVIGLAALLATVISFGSLESTTKYFPRQWLVKDFDGIWYQVNRLYRQFGLRFALIGAVVAAGVAWLASQTLTFVILVFIFGYSLLLLNLSASVVRATGDVKLIKEFNFLRGLIPLLVSVPLALFFGWRVIVIGEICAALIVAIIAQRRCMAQAQYAKDKPASPDQAGDDTASDKTQAGFNIYIAKLASSSVALGDRAFIGLLAGASLVGSYATLALFVQAGLLLSGIICQKVGPDIIKAVYQSKSLGPVRQSIMQSIGYITGGSVALFGLIWLASGLPAVAAFLGDRDMTLSVIAVGCIAFATHFYAILEYVLIAQNEEKGLVISGLTAASIFFPLAGWTALYHPSASGLILCVIAARLGQLCVLGGLLFSITMRKPLAPSKLRVRSK